MPIDNSVCYLDCMQAKSKPFDTTYSAKFHILVSPDPRAARHIRRALEQHNIVISMNKRGAESPLLFMEHQLLRRLCGSADQKNFCSRYPERNSLLRMLFQHHLGVAIDYAEHLDESAIAFLAQLPSKSLIVRDEQKFSRWLSAFRGEIDALRWMKYLQVQIAEPNTSLPLSSQADTHSGHDWESVLRNLLTSDWKSPVILFDTSPLAQRKITSWLKSWATSREIYALSVLPERRNKFQPLAIRESLSHFAKRNSQQLDLKNCTLILNCAENLTSDEVDWLRHNQISLILLVRNIWKWHDGDIALATEASWASHTRYVSI